LTPFFFAKIFPTFGSFFSIIAFARLIPGQKRYFYLRAMAELWAGPHRTGDIANLLNVKITGLGPTRANLINKGMVLSPSHGNVEFTVPLFDEFMRRAVPEFSPRDS